MSDGKTQCPRALMPLIPVDFLACRTVATPIGDVFLAATAIGIIRLGLPREHPQHLAEDLIHRLGLALYDTAPVLDTAATQLAEYCAGERLQFALPLDWRLSHGFARQVQHLLCTIPYGTTCSYKDLAQKSGRPRATRAVGVACAANPLPIIVPCHRVICANGDLGGYRGGVPTKVSLLALEQQAVAQRKEAP